MDAYQAASSISIDIGTAITIIIAMLNIAMVIGLAFIGWLIRSISKEQKRLESDHKDLGEKHEELSLYVNRKTVNRDDYRQDITRIEDLCQKIFDKLDGKVDKHQG